MKCNQIKNNGEDCESPALNGGKFCYFHDPVNQEKRLEDAKKGGCQKLQRISSPLPPIKVESLKNVVDLLVETINLTRDGTLDLKTANTIGFLSGHLIKAMELGFLEERLEKVETIVFERKTFN